MIRRGGREVEPINHLPDFDETNSALDETVRGLMAFNPRRDHSVEIISFMQGTIHDQNTEIRRLREEIAKVVQAVNIKASKEELAGVNTAVTSRLDAIRNWTAIVVTVISVVLMVATFLGRK